MERQDDQGQRRRLQRWSRAHAVLMLGACGASLGADRAWPLAVIAFASFAALVHIAAGAWTPRGDFGSANLITALRLVVTTSIGFGLNALPSYGWAAVVLALLALDGFDGWLARKTSLSSAFGAQFDMEVDALMVLMVELALAQKGGFGAWILITGVLRYAYVLALALVPARRGELPRSRFGRYAFSALVVGLIGALALPHAIGVWMAGIGTALVSASFVRAFHWSYAAALPDAAPEQ